MALGPDGCLWVGALEGLFRYDGKHLEQRLDFPLHVVEFMVVAEGKIWAGFEHRLAVHLGDGWRIYDLPHPISGLNTDGSSLFVGQTGGTLGEDGRWMKFVDGRFIPIGRSNVATLSFDHEGVGWGVQGKQVLSLARGAWEAKPLFATDDEWLSGVVRSSSGRLWLFSGKRAAAYGLDGKMDGTSAVRDWTSKPRSGPYLVSGRSGRVWFLGERITSDPAGGSFWYQSLSGDERIGLAAEGVGGELWIWLASRGLMRLIPDPGWQVFPLEEFGAQGPTAVTRNGKGELWAATGAGMYRMTDGWQAEGGSTRDYVETLALGDGRILAASREEGLWILDGAGRAVRQVKELLPKAVKNYRRLYRDRRGRIWVGNRSGLMEAVAEGDTFRLVHHPLPGEREMPSPIDLTEDVHGRLWVGYSEGLAWLTEGGKWERLATDIPVIDVRTVSADRAGKTLWVGYRKNGFFSRVEMQGGKGVVSQFHVQAGYTPKDTHFIRVDSRGWVWRGSTDGVRVSDGVHFGPLDWLHFHAGNGLAGGEPSANGFFEDRDRTVWLAGGKGMTHVTPSAEWFAAPPVDRPRITRVDVDGELYFGALPEEVPAGVRKIVVRVGSLAASLFRDQPFRYRVGQREWTAVGVDGEIELGRLEGGEYRLEVGFAGGGNATAWEFRVGPKRPAYLAYGLGGLITVGLMGYLLRRTRPMEKLRYRVAKQVDAFRSGDPERRAADLVGRVLSGRYRVRRVLDSGGTSTIYLGFDEAPGGGEVVLKVLGALVAETRWARQSFSMEVMALRSIRHPGVVTLLDSWIDEEGRPILVMPFIAGRTLREVIDGGCPVGAALAILKSLGETLDAVHIRGIVHRDVKPENVIVGEDGGVVLLDFGTAGMAGRSQGVVMTEGVAGSLPYMGPERLGGYFSGATDAYSLGVIAVELLTGKRPGEEGVALEGELAAVVEEVLADSPERRPEKLGEWAERVARASGC